MSEPGTHAVPRVDGANGTSTLLRVVSGLWRAVGPVVYALVAGGVLLLVMGRDPISFYATTIESGLLSQTGLEQSVIRLAPLLLMAAGFIVAFQAGLWNIGGDGQFLVAAAVVASAGPPLVGAIPYWPALILLCILGCAAGAAWTIVPSFLKAWYGVNEIITTLMVGFIGIRLANILIKGPFLSDRSLVPQTDVIPFEYLLPYLPGTRIHVGIVIALVALACVHYMQTRTGYGLGLLVLGANPKAAAHAGIPVKRDIVTAFALSGGLIGLAAAVEVLGVWGYVRADWNPAFGLTLFALVFLAGLNVMVVIPFVAFFAVLSIGGHEAARQAGLPNDFLLLLIGLILFFMVLTEWARHRSPRSRTDRPAEHGGGEERSRE
jgi:general nucleoside transport system permease protein